MDGFKLESMSVPDTALRCIKNFVALVANGMRSRSEVLLQLATHCGTSVNADQQLIRPSGLQATLLHRSGIPMRCDRQANL